MCVCAFVRGGVTPIIANRCAFVFNAPKKSSPSSALPLLFLRCARDDEIDGRSVYPSRWEHHCCTELTQFPVPLILFFLFGLCSVFRTKHTHTVQFVAVPILYEKNEALRKDRKDVISLFSYTVLPEGFRHLIIPQLYLTLSRTSLSLTENSA